LLLIEAPILVQTINLSNAIEAGIQRLSRLADPREKKCNPRGRHPTNNNLKAG